MSAAMALAAALRGTPPLAGCVLTKPGEIVGAAGAGGASDQMARMMRAAIRRTI